MQYPIMRGNGTYKVVAATLNGGVNYSDPPTQIEDNQLTDCENMWWRQGALRTRPGLQHTNSASIRTDIVRHRVNESEEVHVSIVMSGDSTATVYGYVLRAEGTYTPLGCFTVHDERLMGNHPNILAVKTDQPDITTKAPYLFYTQSGAIWRGKANATSQDSMTQEEAYIPTVTVERYDSELGAYQQTAYESLNLLTDKFRASFTTDGERDTFSLYTGNISRQPVTVSVQLYNSRTKSLRTVSGSIVDGYGEITGIDFAEILHEEEPVDNTGTTKLYMIFDYAKGELYIKAENAIDVQKFFYPLPAVTSNNLTVTAGLNVGDERRCEPVCNMRRAIWFGGNRSGLGGGTRLFVGGGTSGMRNLVHWSEMNNPLYFPVNNFFRVGEDDNAVTAFGKQSDVLVIFKEREIFATQYVEGDDLTTDDLISGADASANAAIFPLTPIHPRIGCDCPYSVQLVNNRLVWATSDAHVYMMPSINQYSERNVRDITALIRRPLEAHGAEWLRTASAAEYQGHYMLAVRRTMYLLDVGNSAFQSYQYYASEARANRLLPWYIWSVLINNLYAPQAIVSDGEHVAMATYNGIYTFAGTDDEGEPIACHFATKQYDFGQPDKKKTIREVYLTVGNEGGSCARLSYITERGTVEDAYCIEPTGETAAHQADRFILHRARPNISRVRVFGLRCACVGSMAVEGIRLKYTALGNAR